MARAIALIDGEHYPPVVRFADAADPAKGEAIFAKYEELVAFAAQHLRVVTSEEIAAMAKSPPARARPHATYAWQAR